jgi:biopolymer transport protein ExbD
MGKRPQEDAAIDMTPMIDIVFQLIIFFILTISLEEQAMDPDIILGDSPQGPLIEETLPTEVLIEVTMAGKIKVNGASMSMGMLTSVLATRAQTYGSNNVEVMIRGDKRARHEAIRQAMDAAANAGLWRIKFQAMKEKNVDT